MIDFCYYPGCDNHPSPTTRQPTDPRATYKQLREYNNQLGKWRLKPPTTQTQQAIIELITTSTTTEQYLTSYRIAEMSGMVYFHLSDQPEESDWV